MTIKEDELFMEIMKTTQDIPDDIKVERMLVEFAKLYKDKTDNKEFKANPMVLEIVKQIIPEYWL